MFPARTPAVLRALLPGALWRMPGKERAVYLSFDDGPTPEVTPWVLDLLAQHQARATFFVLGKNAAAQPALLERMHAEGHSLGNHTWDHPNGWRTPTDAYLENIERARSITRTRLFRPPYGRISWRQARLLRDRYTVVMWDVLSFDFAVHITGERCLRNVMRNIRPGSIVVFHDSIKAEPRLRYALPRVLEQLALQGYRSLPISEGITGRRR